MKKILLLFLGLSLSVSAMAQNTNVTTKAQQNHNLEGGDITDDNSGFGIKGGANFNMLRGDGKDVMANFKNQTTWHAGAYLQFPIRASRSFSVQLEALYNSREFNSDELDLKLNSVEVPFLFVYDFFDNVALQVGPYAGLLISANENGREAPEAEKKKLNSFMYGVAGGLEAKVSIARIGARYGLGLNDVFKEDKVIDAAQNKVINDVKNGVFQVYLGVGF